MKKLLVLIMSIVIAVTCSLTLEACSQMYVEDLTNVRMTSNDPETEIILVKNGESFGYIIHNGEKIKFYCSFFKSKFNFELKQNIEPEDHESISKVIGTAKYLPKEKKVILSIHFDYFFGNSYKTITLNVTNIDLQDDVRPNDRNGVSWIAQGVNMFFIIDQNTCQGGNGHVKIDTDVIKIYFKWDDGQRFSVYLFTNDNTIDESSVMNGTYHGGGETFTISIEKDELFSNIFTTITFASQLYSPPDYVPPTFSN